MRDTVTIKQMLAIGDSITYGFPYDPACSWVNLVSRQLHTPIANRGICGETTGDMLDRFESEIAAHKAEIVIITGGSNDAYFGISVPDLVANLSEMLTISRRSGLIPVIGLPPPIIGKEEARLAEYRQSLRELAAEFSAPILDFYLPFVDTEGGHIRTGLLVDEVHPNLAGYAAMAEVAQLLLGGLNDAVDR